MHKLALAFLLLFLIPADQTRAQQQRESPLFGFGGATCALYADWMKDDPRAVESDFYSWAQGYMSGLNTQALVGDELVVNLFGISAEQQRLMINQYCSENPLKLYFQAVQTVWLKLLELEINSSTAQ